MPNETCKKFAETLIAEFHSIFGVTPEVEHNSEYSTVTLDIWNCDPNVVNKRSIEKLVCRITQRLNLDPDLTTYDLTRGHMMVQYRQDAFWITSKKPG